MPKVASFSIPCLERTALLGGFLARAVRLCNPGALLLYGPLGAGKTTLVRFLVRALPGGDTAEVASPSFTIANIYCTAPVVHHFDLYRLEAGMREEALEESFDAPSILTVVEWPERLMEKDLPEEHVSCRLVRTPEEAAAHFTGAGRAGGSFLEALRAVIIAEGVSERI